MNASTSSATVYPVSVLSGIVTVLLYNDPFTENLNLLLGVAIFESPVIINGSGKPELSALRIAGIPEAKTST